MNLQSSPAIRRLIGICLLLSLSSACVVNPTASQPDPQTLRLPDFEDLLPDGPSNINDISTNPQEPLPSNRSNFIATLSAYGIRLNNAELASLKHLTSVKPTGKWSRTRTQSAEQALNANFRRFGSLFQPPPNDAEEYRLRAVSFAEKNEIPYFLDLQYYLDTNQFLVVRWDEKTGEFISIQPDGSLINYLISTAVKSSRYIRIDL